MPELCSNSNKQSLQYPGDQLATTVSGWGWWLQVARVVAASGATNHSHLPPTYCAAPTCAVLDNCEFLEARMKPTYAEELQILGKTESSNKDM